RYARSYYLRGSFLPGSTRMWAGSGLSGAETLAVRAPGSGNVHVLVVNRQVDGPTAVGGPGLPATGQVTVGNLRGITQVSLRQFDDATPLATGAPAPPLPVGNSATVSFNGSGAAILE